MAHESERPELTPERPVCVDTETLANGEPVHPGAPALRTAKPAERPGHAEPAPAQSRSAGGSTFFNVLVSCVFGAVAGAGGAWFFLNYLNAPQPGGAIHATQAAPTPLAMAPPAPPLPGVSPEEFKELDKQVNHISDRLDRLQERFASIPKPEPAPDLPALTNQIIAQVKSDPSLAALPGRLAAFTDRVAALEQSEAALRSALESLGKPVKKPETSRTPSTSSPNSPRGALLPSASSDQSVVGAAINEGVDLIREGHFTEARDLFAKLADMQPEDARIWYLGALATGLATNNWDGEARRLADKGVERERAGTPSSSRIDSALARLTLPTGRDWLAFYRRGFTH